MQNLTCEGPIALLFPLPEMFKASWCLQQCVAMKGCLQN